MLLHTQTSGTITRIFISFYVWRPWRNRLRTFQNIFGYKCLQSYYQSFNFFSITRITKLLIKNVIKFPIWRILRLANKRVITRHHRSPQVCIALRRSTPHAECCTIQHDYILQRSESGVNMYVNKSIYCFILSLVLSTSLRLVVSFDIHVQVCVILGFKKGQSQYSARST